MTRSPSRRPAANAGLSARERRTLRPSGRISGSVISTRSRKRTSASSLGARSVALTDDDIGDTHVFVSDQPGCFNWGHRVGVFARPSMLQRCGCVGISEVGCGMESPPVVTSVYHDCLDAVRDVLTPIDGYLKKPVDSLLFDDIATQMNRSTNRSEERRVGKG